MSPDSQMTAALLSQNILSARAISDGSISCLSGSYVPTQLIVAPFLTEVPSKTGVEDVVPAENSHLFKISHGKHRF